MPPKKVEAKKAAAVNVTPKKLIHLQEQAQTSYPTNECKFLVNFELKHEGGHNLKVKYDWFRPEPGSADKLAFYEVDSGFLKEWTLIQIEGEDPQPVEVVVLDPKAKAKAPPKKAVVEEVIDNRPRTIQFKKDVSEGVEGMRFSEQLAVQFQNAFLNLRIYNNEKVIETIQIDLTCMLFPDGKLDVSICM